MELLWPANRAAWEIILRFERGLIDRQVVGKYVHWNINFTAIEAAFRHFQVPEAEQGPLMDKILTFTELAIAEEAKLHA